MRCDPIVPGQLGAFTGWQAIYYEERVISVNFRISCITHDDSSVSVYFEHFGHWDNFDWIIGLLEQENECEVQSNDQSQSFRLAKLSHKNIEFVVWYNDMLGNFMFSKNNQDADVLKQLAENVISSITQRLAEQGVVLDE